MTTPLWPEADVVRESYDAVASAYADLVETIGMGDVRTTPVLRGMIDAFAEAVREVGPVVDVGCGPGQVTAYLVERGLDVRGIDLSPRMIDEARARHPGCTFAVGSATDVIAEPESLGGILGWWSLFNLPRAALPQVFSGFFTALRPGGWFIMATHAGDGDHLRERAYGDIPVRWVTHWWRSEDLTALLTAAGFVVVADLRLPETPDQTPGVVLLAQRPRPSASDVVARARRRVEVADLVVDADQTVRARDADRR